jgi:AraC family transcriptional regulator, melibiose operon regulatory protein
MVDRRELGGGVSHPDVNPGHPLVVFDDHGFCADNKQTVHLMPAPHMHSQIEINYLLEGHMTYRFDGRAIALGVGDLAIFWGTVPHQVVSKAPVTRFVCLYTPLPAVLALGLSGAMRKTLLNGGFIQARRIHAGEADQFQRWFDDLMAHDPRVQMIVRDELGARIRRVDIDGWTDLRALSLSGGLGREAGRRLDKVEAMARFVGEHAGEAITVDDVAAAAGLHPNYAMALFRKSIGLTINQFITRARLDTAQALLVASQRDVTDIAFDAGFGSLSRFYEAFQAKFGLSPARFRKFHRGPVGAT